MIREIIEVTEETFVLKFPNELIGKKVEITASEIVETKLSTAETLDREQRLQDIRERYAKLPRISHENFKFDRDEANDYE